MESPDGSERQQVEPSEVAMFIKAGARRVPRSEIARTQQAALETNPNPLIGGGSRLLYGALEHLPDIGAAVGGGLGFAGGTIAGAGVGGVPGGIGGAALGGAGGEAAKQLIERALGLEDIGAAEAAGRIGTQGATQAALEATGVPLVKGAQLLGKGVMAAGLRVPGAMRNEFPNIVKDALENRVMAGTPENVSKIPRQVLDEAIPEARRLVRDAKASGTRIPARELTGQVKDMIKDFSQHLDLEEAAKLKRKMESFNSTLLNNKERQLIANLRKVDPSYARSVREHLLDQKMLSPVRVRRIKQLMQRTSSSVMRAERRGMATEGSALTAQFRNKIAKDARQSLVNNIKGYGEAEGEVQRAIGLGRGVRQAEMRARPITSLDIVHNFAANPSAMTALALGLTSNPMLLGLSNLPRGFGAAYRAVNEANQ